VKSRFVNREIEKHWVAVSVPENTWLKSGCHFNEVFICLAACNNVIEKPQQSAPFMPFTDLDPEISFLDSQVPYTVSQFTFHDCCFTIAVPRFTIHDCCLPFLVNKKTIHIIPKKLILLW